VCLLLFFKTCKARSSLREEGFTQHNLRRTPKELKNKPNKKERGSPHHRHDRNNLRTHLICSGPRFVCYVMFDEETNSCVPDAGCCEL
jgi:hypothetical protein